MYISPTLVAFFQKKDITLTHGKENEQERLAFTPSD